MGDDGEPKAYGLCEVTDRYKYRTEHEEDRRLSPYIPLWLLGWGANMNIQYCTTASFLSYIAKYVAKPERAVRAGAGHGGASGS